MLGLRIASALVLATVITGQEPGSANWNQWRGPHRSGLSQAAAWPERLTPDTLSREWCASDLGPSYSGPVMDESRVYTTETVDEEEEVVRAFDRESGEELWSTRWEGSMQVPFFAARNGSWIRSTPAVHGDSLYVAGIRDVLVCLDTRTGEERWRVDFTERFGAPLPTFGFASSPLVADGAVYVQAGASLVKLDSANGDTIWRSMEDGGGMMGSAFSSPVLADLAGETQLLVASRSSLVGVRPNTGDVLWSQPIRTFRGMNILTPQPYGDGVFLSAYGGRAQFFSVHGDGEEFVAEELWNNRAQANMTSPVVIDQHAYLYLRSKRFCCVDLESGEVAFISEPLGDEYWSIVGQGDRMLALNESGELFMIEANPQELRIIDRMEVADTETWAHLAVDRDQVMVRSLDQLITFRWQSPN